MLAYVAGEQDKQPFRQGGGGNYIPVRVSGRDSTWLDAGRQDILFRQKRFQA